jgi:hypothetical protein
VDLRYGSVGQLRGAVRFSACDELRVLPGVVRVSACEALRVLPGVVRVSACDELRVLPGVVRVSACDATTLGCVTYVLSLGACLQVLRVAAARYIAAMSDYYVRWGHRAVTLAE